MAGGIKNHNISVDCGLDNLKRALFRNGEFNGYMFLEDFNYPAGDNTWYGANKIWAFTAGAGACTAVGLAAHGGVVRMATPGAGNCNVAGNPNGGAWGLVDFDKKPKFIFYFRTSATLADAVQYVGIRRDANEFALLLADADTNANFRFQHAAGGATTTVVSAIPIVANTWYAMVLEVGAPTGTGGAKRFPVSCKMYSTTSPTPTVIAGGSITDDDTHAPYVFLSSAAAIRNLDLDIIAIGANR